MFVVDKVRNDIIDLDDAPKDEIKKLVTNGKMPQMSTGIKR